MNMLVCNTHTNQLYGFDEKRAAKNNKGHSLNANEMELWRVFIIFCYAEECIMLLRWQLKVTCEETGLEGLDYYENKNLNFYDLLNLKFQKVR
jgi:hypothetical protein